MYMLICTCIIAYSISCLYAHVNDHVLQTEKNNDFMFSFVCMFFYMFTSDMYMYWLIVIFVLPF